MATTTISSARVERIPTGRILRAGAIAAVVAALANTVVRVLAVTLQPVDPGFMPLGWAPPAVSSVVGAIGATVVFWIISRVWWRPARVFTSVAVGVLLLSMIPLYPLLQGTGRLVLPGTNTWTVSGLAVMHVVAFAVIVPLLNRTARPSAG